MTPPPVLLVGSVPLENAAAVFDIAARELGGLLTRYPDGETGSRSNWIAWQRKVFESVPVMTPAASREREYQLFPPYTLRDGATEADVKFGDLGFAREALRSHALFAGKKREGGIPAGARFLVALPTAWAPVYSFVAYRWQRALHPVYEAALLAEVKQIVAAIPPQDLAIQWDVATEMSWWEGVYPAPFEPPKQGIVESVTRLLDAVPPAVELGVHLCYGSMNNRHWKEPQDTANLVEVANAVAASAGRPIDYLHLPVPVDRDDDAFFAPLKYLSPAAGKELYLGLLHLQDGVEGALRRMRSARKFSRPFGLACECGLGRYAADAVPGLMALHRDAAGADAAARP